jgi:hypothetical protein
VSGAIEGLRALVIVVAPAALSSLLVGCPSAPHRGASAAPSGSSPASSPCCPPIDRPDPAGDRAPVFPQPNDSRVETMPNEEPLLPFSCTKTIAGKPIAFEAMYLDQAGMEVRP